MALADSLSETILGLPSGKFADYPYKMIITPEDGKTIGIEAVRQLEHFLSLKVPSLASYDRIVIIEDAHLLGTEAQNALLKTLEEPPTGTLVIMSASHEQALLPTIRSRTQSISVKRPGAAAAAAHFTARGFDQAAVKQTYAISGGLPGLMQALLSDEDHPLKLATEKARQLLSQTAYERLLIVDELSKQKGLALDVMFILQQMANISLQTASEATAVKWQAVLASSYEAAEALKSSAQPKLVLTKLMLSV